jgi:NAD(P)-dependent dehydrogenase (short-subunit alcohol dehydrogenase family)
VSLQNRVAVVTGATGGLGRIVCAALAERGAKLVIVSTNMEKLNALARELNLSSERFLAHAAQLSDAAAAQELARAVMDKFGRADILAHLVGGWLGGKPIAETEAAQVQEMLDQHVWTTFHLTHAFAPLLLANQWGRVFVISSPTASNPLAKRAPYAIGKAAQEVLLLTLAREVAGTGVTANVLLVDTIDTQHERDTAPTPKNAKWTTPEEIAAAILYLCSDAAHVVNGARIPLFGG